MDEDGKKRKGKDDAKPSNESVVTSMKLLQNRKIDPTYDEYLMAMKRVHHRHSSKTPLPIDMQSPRERRRHRDSQRQAMMDSEKGNWSTKKEATRISVIASMVPDEIIYQHNDHSIRSYETALMFIDISGFTNLCETYTKMGHGGPSRLTQVLNSYIGAMVQEILTYNGDIIKFSGDALISMWKKTPRLTMQDVVHSAIDCGLIIQKNYGTHVTDIGVKLRVKVAIAAGDTYFSIIGDEKISQCHFVLVGQSVLDVKMAQSIATAGDVLTSASAWMYVNEAEYCTQPCGDGRHTKVLGVGASWKKVEKVQTSLNLQRDTLDFSHNPLNYKEGGINYKEYSLRPAVVASMRSSWWPSLRRFMLPPVLRAVDNDEPMDFLTEVRRVVVVFMNIITKTVTEDVVIDVINTAYKCILSVSSELGGLVNKVLLFDKDMMFLVVFGMRGLKHDDEAQRALLCAYQVKEKLTDENIISVSIGITSGTTYCGVVGHVLRRDYTVIGSAVNKAARLMMAYPKMVTCDKETFLRSKLDQEYFRHVEVKVLKGIAKPGPIYEFNQFGWSEELIGRRHPILGRNEELQKFKITLQNALEEQSRRFTRYRDHKYAVAFIGPKLIGKKRLLDECLNLTPNFIPAVKIVLTEYDQEPYALVRLIFKKNIKRGTGTSLRDSYENIIRYSVDTSSITPVQIHAMNTIFDCRFPLPENFHYTDDFLIDITVKTLIQDIVKKNFKSFWVLAVQEAQHTDNQSWRILLMMMEIKSIFFILSISEEDKLSTEASNCLVSNMIVKIYLNGIDRCYHAALACQLLDVQAIPADLEKVIESASGGLPGWIQNFVISLVQRGALNIVSLPRSEAVKSTAIVPSSTLLQRSYINCLDKDYDDLLKRRHSFQSIYSMMSAGMVSKQDSVSTLQENEVIQMAVLAESFNFDDLQVDMTIDGKHCEETCTSVESRVMFAIPHWANVVDYGPNPPRIGRHYLGPVGLTDSPLAKTAYSQVDWIFTDVAIILKTFDSLTPFEKMLLKCGSVLGEVFSRRMLLHLLQSDSSRKVAEAIAKLFRIRVLECERGDFTRDTSMILTHSAPTLPDPKPPYCACLGTRKPHSCRDLPMYAFCGYMKFRHSLFRTTTYELLTENHKHELHTRALLYLERYTRRCAACGAGCFTKLFGQRCDDGLIDESEDLKLMRRQICALSDETRIAGEPYQPSLYLSNPSLTCVYNIERNLSCYEQENEGTLLNLLSENQSTKGSRRLKHKRVRSFSSLELDSCECLAILQSVYGQCIDHCRGAGEFEKLFEAYLEYADLCLTVDENIPQAIRLLFEVEDFIKNEKFYPENIHKNWVRDFRLAKVCSMRGVCMLESGDLTEARHQLFQAMKLYCDPFPTSKHWVNVCNIGASIQQVMALYIVPNLYIARDSDTINGYFYEDIANTLNRLYRLFTECKEISNATLAAKMALNYALRTSSNLRLMCITYGNMIATYRNKLKFSVCQKLEKQAMELCHRKRGQLDVTEVRAVCYLYTNIFIFYVTNGKKTESLELGISVMHMTSSMNDLYTRYYLVLWMLKLLLSDLRIMDMVTIMREFLYTTDHYDMSSETWYYYYSMVILLDTGYCVESYGTCEKFYIKKGDALLRSKTPQAAWNFFVCMWLITIRIGAWERSILWEDKIRHILSMKFDGKDEFTMLMVNRLVEGLLITLVKEMDNRNIKKIILLEKSLKKMLQDINKTCHQIPMYRPRYYLLMAYYNYITGRKHRAYNYLNKAREHSKQYLYGTIMIWVEHTRNHWKETLHPMFTDYWTEHIEPGKLLDYREFDPEKGKIIPYTLPLPKDLER